jgi:hypothetical protein
MESTSAPQRTIGSIKRAFGVKLAALFTLISASDTRIK